MSGPSDERKPRHGGDFSLNLDELLADAEAAVEALKANKEPEFEIDLEVEDPFADAEPVETPRAPPPRPEPEGFDPFDDFDPLARSGSTSPPPYPRKSASPPQDDVGHGDASIPGMAPDGSYDFDPSGRAYGAGDPGYDDPGYDDPGYGDPGYGDPAYDQGYDAGVYDQGYDYPQGNPPPPDPALYDEGRVAYQDPGDSLDTDPYAAARGRDISGEQAGFISDEFSSYPPRDEDTLQDFGSGNNTLSEDEIRAAMARARRLSDEANSGFNESTEYSEADEGGPTPDLEIRYQALRYKYKRLKQRYRKVEAQRDEARERLSVEAKECARLTAATRRLSDQTIRADSQVETYRQARDTAEGRVSDLRDALEQTLQDLGRQNERHKRELEDRQHIMLAKGLGEVLLVLDHLEMAMAHADADPRHVVQGVDMVLQQFQNTLSRLAVTRIEVSRGSPFDPVLHDAIAQEECEDCEPGTVIEVAQTGYTLGSRLLRPARVTVAAGTATTPFRSAAPDVDGDEEGEPEQSVFTVDGEGTLEGPDSNELDIAGAPANPGPHAEAGSSASDAREFPASAQDEGWAVDERRGVSDHTEPSD